MKDGGMYELGSMFYDKNLRGVYILCNVSARMGSSSIELFSLSSGRSRGGPASANISDGHVSAADVRRAMGTRHNDLIYLDSVFGHIHPEGASCAAVRAICKACEDAIAQKTKKGGEL